ncbi:hypothetical protein SYNPS1DRAFT_26696 [Syncephalis pseudoplumigaleata]|uniref:Uncharacterized protein n=1 Tax=Syncephalis pseudoplumigaleata TaxID=1712513 RepID=A0A4P9Z553_9FUNG|nr:hypothetical protein SYNPS1DRAFT_26696 [Syncephalis pseudoplumigaleata]|eukprot:RKP27656.1 hypothetical protein SYNPS1DRAFT_26696 [Syncephalis pseudoplumigaleata]
MFRRPSVTSPASPGGYPATTLRQPSKLSAVTAIDDHDHPSEYSALSSSAHNGMPPAPLPEDNAAGMGGGQGGDFDLSDEQAEQLLRELDLLGAQLQIMDHETRMLGTKTGNNTQSSLANSSSINNNNNSHQNGIAASSAQGRGGSVTTPYRMQLTEQPVDVAATATTATQPWDTQSSVDLGGNGQVADDDAGTVRSRSAGRTPRKQRALFVPRKPTTAEALMAVDVSSMPVNPLDLEPLELAPEPSNNPLSPKRWVNSVSRFLNRRNSVSGAPHLVDLASSPGSLERSRTTGMKPRPQSLMMFSAGSRRQSAIFTSPTGQRPTKVDLSTLTTTTTATTSPSSSPVASPTTPEVEASTAKSRRARPYSMGFFTRSNTAERLATTGARGNGISDEDDTLLRRLDALNQELNANPKSVRLHNDSVQAGTAALFSLARRRPLQRSALSMSDDGSGHIVEEGEGDDAQRAIVLNASGAPNNHTRSMSASVYTVG